MSTRNIKILVTVRGALLSTDPGMAYRNVATPVADIHPAARTVMSNTDCEAAEAQLRP